MKERKFSFDNQEEWYSNRKNAENFPLQIKTVTSVKRRVRHSFWYNSSASVRLAEGA